MWYRLICCFLLLVSGGGLLSDPLDANASSGISISGTLHYPASFTHFDYTSEKATKGGSLVLHDLGSFDKLNPFTLKGVAPLGIGELVFESLGTSSLDEPYAKYGLLADDIAVSQDKMSMTVHIDKKAQFSNGSPVEAKDVAFSFDLMKSDKVHPFYASYYEDIKDCIVLDAHTVRVDFAKKNRELPLIALDIPIFSKNFYKQHTFGNEETNNPHQALLGSGPYTIDSLDMGKSIRYRRNPHYWAQNKNVRKGMYNFDTISVKYYKDETVSVEGFKAGDFDVYYVNIAKQWVRDMIGPKFDSGALIKKKFVHSNNTGMQCFVFNTRRKIFSDVRVRKALNMAFDFEWINKALFFGQYERNESFFSNSYLAAKGIPQGLELQYLTPFKNQLPQDVFTQPLQTTRYEKRQDTRANLKKALALLGEAGWTVQNGKLCNKEGIPFTFEILLASPTFNRVIAPFEKNLKRLGIDVIYRIVDPALYMERVRKFDFDMVVHVFGQSLSPGNEQKNFWSSAAATREGSGNLAGIQSPVVDDLIKKIIYRDTPEQLTAATRALDRVLWYGYYVIPQWHTAAFPLAYANKFQQPDKLPLYYDYFQLLMTWWQK